MPTKNSWPTRWASVIPEKTCSGQEAGAEDADAADAADGRWRLDAGLTRLATGCGALPPDASPHPELAKPTDTAPASSAQADWRRTRAPNPWLLPSRSRT